MPTDHHHRLRSLILGGLLLLSACAISSGPRIIPSRALLAPVTVTKTLIAGAVAPNTPSSLNNAIVLRYRANTSLASGRTPRAILVFMPGFLGGATNFDPLARRILSQDPSLEVWALDRRSNALEDHSLLLAAQNNNDPLLAWRYYIRDSGKPGGFRPREDLAMLGGWGLAVHLNDLHATILEAHKHAPKVYLGGHSLGSVMATLYSGWDFGGKAGAEYIDGLMLLDGAAGTTTGGGGISEKDYQDGFTGFQGPTAGVRALEAGTALPYIEASGFGLGPLPLAKNSAAALLAALAPEADSPGGLVEYPASNLAAALVGGDDDYGAFSIFTISSGRAEGALATNGLAVLLNGLSGLQIASVVGPSAGQRRVEWIKPDPNNPGKEQTDPSEFVRAFWRAVPDQTGVLSGVDYNEWYFPVRLSLDIAFVGLEAPAWAQPTLPLRHLAAVKLPILAVAGGRGITNQAAYGALEQKLGRKLVVQTMPLATHLDVLSAGGDLPGWIVDFVR
jgi:hypothetical protein